MAQINKWECGMCHEVFGEADAGFNNRKTLDIEINLGMYQGTQAFYYEDTCLSCREKINKAIFGVLNDVTKK